MKYKNKKKKKSHKLNFFENKVKMFVFFVSSKGVDHASDMISRFVRVVDPPKWPNAQPCPMCLEELIYDTRNPAISLSRCQHLVHLQCLNDLIISQQLDPQKSLYIECPVCGIVYGEKVGNQPVGTMSWKIMQKSLPGHEGQNTIQIVYE